MSIATPTATQAATQASLPSRAAVRWYQLAVIVLGVALAAVTALAVYLAVSNPTAAPSGTPGPGPRSPAGSQRSRADRAEAI